MDLGIKFPSHEEVVIDAATRFRALSTDDQRRSIDDSFRLYQFLMRNCDHPDFARRSAEEQELQSQAAIFDAVKHYER